MILKITDPKDRERIIEINKRLTELQEEERESLRPRLLSLREIKRIAGPLDKVDSIPIISISCHKLAAINRECEKLMNEHNAIVAPYYAAQVACTEERPEPCVLDITQEEVKERENKQQKEVL